VTAADYLSVLTGAFQAVQPLVLVLLTWALILNFATWGIEILRKAGGE